MPKRCIRIFGPAIHHKKARIQKIGHGNISLFFYDLLQNSHLAGHAGGLLDADHVAAREQKAPGINQGLSRKVSDSIILFQNLGASGSRKNERPH